jgi:glycogen synthase
MNVAFLASEVIPYAKTGGLADVAGALPKFLSGLGADIRVFMPLYREVRKKGLPLTTVLEGASVDLGGTVAPFGVFEHRAEGVATWFIDRPEFFDRDGLYGTSAGDYPDNGERFAFFCRAALETMRVSGPTSSTATTGRPPWLSPISSTSSRATPFSPAPGPFSPSTTSPTRACSTSPSWDASACPASCST